MSSRSMLAPRIVSLGLACFALSACSVDPYCFDCVDERLDAGRPDSGDSGLHDSATDTGTRDAMPDTNPPDAWMGPDGCALGATELCNRFDDDCDLMIDEGVNTTTDVENCGSCGHRCSYAHAFGDCQASTCAMGACQVGYYDINASNTDGCEYHCIPTGAEVCDRRDNNCDGNIDEGFVFATDPMNCGICGRVCNLAHATSSCTSSMCTIGICAMGFVDRDGVAANGCEYSCTPSASGVEMCNRVDDDCDGTVDEDIGSGGACGSSAGICRPGTLTCVGGSFTCSGGTSPGVESCNGLDDDCDGVVDQGNPGGGAACGNNVGSCLPGRQTCTAGALVCTGGTGPTAEVCNGLDDDCNGTPDDGDPGGGASCGLSVGACTPGMQHCTGGSISCIGGNGPTLEVCNMVDDDCNGVVDDGYDLMNDVRNCGTCGHVCSFPNAVSQCTMGSCSILACAGGYVNLDMSPTGVNGCEYMCTRTSATESCNGVDDNCNGTIDEGVVIPANFCRTAGVCAGSTASCAVGVLACNYPATYQVSETRCDTLDNDCNGVVDDPWPQLNPASPSHVCNNGQIGACNRPGVFVCMGTSAIMCNAPAGLPGVETCNGLDDDCNGVADNGTTARGAYTQVRPVGGAGPTDFWIQSYEASRPGATALVQGSYSNVACSVPNVLPWTSVTPIEAQAACAATGGSLCTEAQWQRACNSSVPPACTWSEASACAVYSPTACNGVDYDTDPATAGNQDALISTGTLNTCRVPWTVVSTTQIYDMSGNAQEWTAPRAAMVNPIRGGSYNDISGGMTCGFNFEVAGDTIRLPNTGFRCCRTTAP